MTYISWPWEIEYADGVDKEEVKAFGGMQRAQIHGQLVRVQRHGRSLNGDYFGGKVRGSKKRLEELRLCVQDVEARFLFVIEPPNTCLLLACYKEDVGGIPIAKIRAAEKRLDTWKKRPK